MLLLIKVWDSRFLGVFAASSALAVRNKTGYYPLCSRYLLELKLNALENVDSSKAELNQAKPHFRKKKKKKINL